jgi:hypothetical protein
MSGDAYDLGAEQALLGAALTDAPTAGPVLLAVPPAAWWHHRHKAIAAVITTRLRAGKAVDPQLVLTDTLGRTGFGDDIGPYLVTLIQRTWSPAHADAYAERVMHCYARRNLDAGATALRQQLERSWANGYDEPITDFTRQMRAVLETAEHDGAGITDDVPSMTLTDLLAGQDEHDWLVPGLLERGERMILTGTEGLGKSYAISQFGLAMAAGLHPFTGNPLAGDHQLRVLVVDCENGLPQSRRRFRKIADQLGKSAWPAGDNLRIELRPNGLNLLGPDAAWLDRKVAQNAPDLLICGPLYRLHYANMNDEPAARELVRVLDTIRTRYGCALMTEAHPGHAEDGSGVRRMRPAGSSLFLRWPEFGFGLRRAKDVKGEHPNLVDVVPWRGSREERQWPRQLRYGRFLPWEPADRDYTTEVAT